MAGYRLSHMAETDLMDIATYTLTAWGQDKAVHYVEVLEKCCQQLAKKPELGRPCDQIRSGLRRIESGSHVVFYRIEAEGILISRILHQRMLPERQNIDEE